MLTHVYRYGPSRQRILKGFVVAGQEAERIVSRVVKEWPASLSGALNLSADARFPTNVWLDTGLVWLHTPQARARHFSQLAESARGLAQSVTKAGGKLLPNAIRLSTSEAWESYLCSDRHLLETFDDSEKEVYCNLLRVHLPVLIALTGRAGVSPQGVEPVASRHLANSSHHLAARYLASVSPQYLQRVVQCLRRDQGVGILELLDVYPLADNGENGVEIRFTDGQILLSSVRAQALLYQALLIKARRLTRSGRRIGNVRQSLVERNRGRAITDGLQARLEVEVRKLDEGRGPRTSTQTRQGTTRGERNPKEFLSAREAALSLLEELASEFHVLEVEFAEIAPLVIGAGLRAIGLAGLQNESDLMREWLRQSHAQSYDLLSRLPDMVYQFSPGQDDALTALNKLRFGQSTERLQRWWELMLKTSARSESLSLRSRVDHSSEKVTERSVARDGRRGDRAPREQYSNSSRSESAEGGKSQEHRAEGPAQQRNQQELLTRAATELLKGLRQLGTTATKSEYSSALIAFQRTGRSSSLNRAAAVLPAADAEELGRLLEHILINPHVSDEPARGWDGPACRSACEQARREGLATVLLRASVELENRLRDKALRMAQERPTGIGAFFLQRQNYDVGGEDLTGVRLVLVRTVSEADVS
ncbi:MAG: hypothetical protein H7Z16_02935 [Pyrinomonadaceae bacterium]|nr:hypothetical protein [Pyrinomonadaceae bacterium]